MPESPIKTPARPHYMGAAALSVGFASLLLALSEGTEWGWTSPGVLALVALVIDRCRPEESGVASGMNTLMRASGAAIGAQLAAAIVSANPGPGDGYTIAFAMAAIGLVVALAPTLVLNRRRTLAPTVQLAPA